VREEDAEVVLAWLSPEIWTAGRERRTNVVLVSIDTLRADHVHSYGYARYTSPTLDALARQGTRFERCEVQFPLTAPSHTTMLTGVYPTTHGVRGLAERVDARLLSLAEVMRREGYATGAFVSAPALDPLNVVRGLEQGFSVYDFDQPKWPEREGRYFNYREGGLTTDRAVAWMRRNAQRPFFLFVHYYDPHGPYLPPPGYKEPFVGDEIYQGQRRRLREAAGPDSLGAIPRYAFIPGVYDCADYVARYDGEIAYADAQVRRLWLALLDLRVRDRTLFVVTSDHGESLGERQEYFNHGTSLTEDQTRVPLVIVGPGVPRGKAYQELVETADIVPTTLELLGLLPEYRDYLAGRSLAALFRGEGIEERAAFSMLRRGTGEEYSVTDGKYRLTVGSQAEGESERFYAVGEEGKVVEDGTARERLARQLQEAMRRVPPVYKDFVPQGAGPQMSEETKKQLKALGYLQ